jgi:hypothetical protein
LRHFVAPTSGMAEVRCNPSLWWSKAYFGGYAGQARA